MKKTLKLMALLFGVIALATGASSCKDDDDECCSAKWTVSYYSYSVDYSIKICEDGDFTLKIDGEVEEKGDWGDYEDSWSDAKDAVEEQSGEKCK